MRTVFIALAMAFAVASVEIPWTLWFVSEREASSKKQIEADIEADLRKRAEDEQRAKADAIISVIDKNKAAANDMKVEGGLRGIRGYVRDISGFDVSGCTLEFQNAWTDYIAAWDEAQAAAENEAKERTAARRRANAEAAETLVGLLLTPHLTIGALVLKAGEHAAQNEVRQAIEKPPPSSGNAYLDSIIQSAARCRKAAIHAGVRFHAG